jgi:hypothetical protein
MAAVFVFVTLSGHKSVLGADSTAIETMKSHRLKAAGDFYVLETESDAKNKVREIRRLSKQLNYALVQQQGTLSAKDYQQTMKGLGDQINQYKTEITAVTQQMNALPRVRGRLTNNFATEQYAELTLYKNQLQAELNQETLFLNQLKSRPYDPKAKAEVDAKVQSLRESYHQELLDLRPIIDSTSKQYAELTKNEDVQSALVKLSAGAKTKAKLGPSREFTADVKFLERLEREEASEHGLEVQRKPARPTKRAVRSKRSTKPSTTAPSSKPDADGRS